MSEMNEKTGTRPESKDPTEMTEAPSLKTSRSSGRLETSDRQGKLDVPSSREQHLETPSKSRAKRESSSSRPKLLESSSSRTKMDTAVNKKSSKGDSSSSWAWGGAENITWRVENPGTPNSRAEKAEVGQPSSGPGALLIPSPESEHSALGSRKSDLSRLGTPCGEDKRTWYDGMYPTYKTRSKEFRELFTGLNCKFIVDFSCAYHKDILRHGRMYLSTEHCCFYSNIFGYEYIVKLAWKEIVKMSKEKTAYLIPNAIQVITADGTFFFATFNNRDATYSIMYRLWQGILTNSPMSEEEVCEVIMCQYPEEDTGDSSVLQESSINEQEISNTEVPLEDLTGELQSLVFTWIESTEGDLVLNRSIHKPLSQLYSLLYTNSNFYFTFQKDRGSTELDVGDWEKTENGTSSREVAYNMKMNNPVGPKTCQVKELQELRADSIPDRIYFIDTEAFNSGVPYADSFTVKTHICAFSESDAACRLVVKAEIVFRKELWAYLKGKIETNAWNGIRSYYHDLGIALESYSEEDIPRVAEPLKPRQTSNRTRVESLSQEARRLVRAECSSFSTPPAAFKENAFLTIVILVLCFTCIVNVFVLFNLRSVKWREATPLPPPPTIPPGLLQNLPETDKDWVRLLRAQAAKHHQIVQDISDSLGKVTAALSQSEEVLVNIGRMLQTQQSQEDLNTLLHNLQKKAGDHARLGEL